MPTLMWKVSTLQPVFLLLSLASLPVTTDAVTFTVANECKYTVWPGILTSANVPRNSSSSTGYELPAGRRAQMTMAAGWSGRVWGRTGCVFDGSGIGSCVSGDCAGRLSCDGTGAAPPTTLAEFALQGLGVLQDFYDVSLVDGFNLPLSVAPHNSTCKVASCNASIDSGCPAELRVLSPATGAVVGCKSACLAFGTPQYCCSGAYSTPTACKPTAYSRFFKAACPSAYSYAYDDPSSLYTCSSSTYTITFCPKSSSSTSASQTSASSSTIRCGPSLGQYTILAASCLILLQYSDLLRYSNSRRDYYEPVVY